MSDNEKSTEMGRTVPSQSSSHFVIAQSAAEIMVTFGTGRMMFDASGSPAGITVALEWQNSVHMSPVAAKQLAKSLMEAVATYEKTVGPVPEIAGAAISATKVAAEQ